MTRDEEEEGSLEYTPRAPEHRNDHLPIVEVFTLFIVITSCMIRKRLAMYDAFMSNDMTMIMQ